MPSPSTPSLCKIALTYLAAGRSVVPIAPGRKTPSLIDARTGKSQGIKWKAYQTTHATRAEVRRWFAGPHPMGLGIVAGPASGTTASGRRAGLEFLDFDDPDIHERFVRQLMAQGRHALLERLPCEETPTGGRHYGYLCVAAGASTVLARRNGGTTRRGRTKMIRTIEIKGRGGLCVVAPTPPGIHPAHPERGYTVVRGSWTEIPLITPEARQLLLDCAQALDSTRPRQRARSSNTNRNHHNIGSPPPIPQSPHGRKQVSTYVLTCTPSSKGLGEGFLRALFQRPDTTLACAAALGLPTARVGQAFRCILPGHQEARPSASLYWDPKTGALKYHDWHARDGEEWYLLADVRASLAFGRAMRLRGPSLATWQLRLLVEAGVLQRYPVPARALPARARPSVRKVYEGFLFLLACKWWHTPRVATPFAWRFAAAWCEVGTRQAGEAIRWLLAQGFIRQVGRYKGSGRETALFLPAV